MRLLIGSPIRQKPRILREFLLGLETADLSGLEVHYCFVDDNTDPDSTELLARFAERHDCLLLRGEDLAARQPDRYDSDDVTHTWDMTAIHKIAFFKDTIIEYAISRKYDSLFFVDSDIVIDRRTLRHLLSRNVEIVSNVFWTQWQPNWDLEPQCFWMPDLAMQTKSPFAPPMPIEEARQLRRDFFAKMRVPGLYRVDGLGACTLIRCSALEKGVRFRAIPNLSLMGEDRHFCIRAGVLDIPLYFDTVYPVYHIYREEYLNRVEEFKQHGFRFDMCQSFTPKQTSVPSTGSELKRGLKKVCSYGRKKLKARFAKQRPPLRYQNKSSSIAALISITDRCIPYLSAALASAAEAADQFLIYDASSGGEGGTLCAACLAGKPCRILRETGSASVNPFQRLWDALSENPSGWALPLYGCEVLPEGAAFPIRRLTENNAVNAYFFQRYEMWNEAHFRQDTLWPTNSAFVPYLMRYQPGYEYQWPKLPSGMPTKFPEEIWRVRRARIDLQVKNYRWADPKDRQADYDAQCMFGSGDAETEARRCASLLDAAPNLVLFASLPKAFPHPEIPSGELKEGSDD